ncbi:MAG: ATP-binding cassette domain-containing protein [Desulfotomaculaceae bacterium]
MDTDTTENSRLAGTALRLRDISKIYPGTVALHKVNIEVLTGEVHGIIGKNGVGKSTLVEIIAGIIPPSGGEIFIGAQNFEVLSRISARREKIAFVPQEPQVILDFSVAENLFISDYESRGRLIRWQELYAKAERVVEKAGLNMNVRIKAGDLSISEQQLLLVLKACYVEDAQVIILDEASASLSQEDEELLYKIIQERKKQGNTILFISHRTDELLRVCDRVTVL